MAEQPPTSPDQPTPETPPNQLPPQPPPAGYPPPSYYAPPQGYMPPPSFGAQQPPPAGYPVYQQGYYPPGMVPPGYFPQYPAPREYATPPVNPGLPWQVAAPKAGSLIKAWLSVATNLSRQNIASWAAGCQKGWIAKSIATYIALYTLPFVGFAIAGPFVVQSFTANAGQTISATDQQHLFLGFFIGGLVALVIVPLIMLGSIINYAFFWALFMPQHLGTLRERMRRALRPYVLTLPAYGVIGFLLIAVAVPLFFYIFTTVLSTAMTAATTTGTPPTPQFPAAFAFVPLFYLVALGVGVYTYALQIQSGSVGSTLNRWAVFGIILLAAFAYGMVFTILEWIVIFAVGAILGAHQPSSLHLLPLLHAFALRFP